MKIAYALESVVCKTSESRPQYMLNMGLINKVDMVCLSPVGYGV